MGQLVGGIGREDLDDDRGIALLRHDQGSDVFAEDRVGIVACTLDKLRVPDPLGLLEEGRVVRPGEYPDLDPRVLGGRQEVGAVAPTNALLDCDGGRADDCPDLLRGEE
jgi:hypothetical protein